MKNQKYIGLILLLFHITSQAQELDKATVRSMLDSGRFVFIAQTMIPVGGTTRQLNGEYDVRVTKDSLITYLPYIGRAYTGVYPGEEGINFTSSDFAYKAVFKKKKWQVTIKPKNAKQV